MEQDTDKNKNDGVKLASTTDESPCASCTAGHVVALVLVMAVMAANCLASVINMSTLLRPSSTPSHHPVRQKDDTKGTTNFLEKNDERNYLCADPQAPQPSTEAYWEQEEKFPNCRSGVCQTILTELQPCRDEWSFLPLILTPLIDKCEISLIITGCNDMSTHFTFEFVYPQFEHWPECYSSLVEYLLTLFHEPIPNEVLSGSDETVDICNGSYRGIVTHHEEYGQNWTTIYIPSNVTNTTSSHWRFACQDPIDAVYHTPSCLDIARHNIQLVTISEFRSAVEGMDCW